MDNEDCLCTDVHGWLWAIPTWQQIFDPNTENMIINADQDKTMLFFLSPYGSLQAAR